MTDERNNCSQNNSNNNNNTINSSTNNNTNSNNSSEHIFAEAAKIFLKNGLNGTNAAAAAATLFTAAAAASHFQLPTPPLFSESAIVTSTLTASTPNATTSSATNGLLSQTAKLSFESTSSYVMSAVTASNPLVAPTTKTDVGVIDYTLNNIDTAVKNNNSLHKYAGNNLNSGYGGRLQFFKDGKFILELARSEDGEKGGWVSVPRKTFRTPSAATSATVTPTSATTATYPKNENSTSLSFSDDNSSIQSSPWQRDHSWKQSRPLRSISKEMSLFYQRPKNFILTKRGLKAAAKKRRKPYENTKTVLDQVFERVDDSNVEKLSEETLKNESIIEAAETEDNTPTNESKPTNKDRVTYTNKEITIKAKDENEIKKVVKEENLGHITDDNQTGNKVTVPEMETIESDEDVQLEIKMTNSTAALSMETCENDEDAILISVEEIVQKPTENGIVDVAGMKTDTDLNTKNTVDTKCSNQENEEEMDVNKRLKKTKTRAKLNTIIQKLIDNVPARLEQLSKTPVNTVSGNSGAATNLSQSLANKVSPPSSAATRLVEYHQQHVSPRKRILREFEKVSLEDSNANNGAGGKRSRAKGNNTTTVTQNLSPSRSPMSGNCLPTSISTPFLSITTSLTTSVNNSNTLTAKSSTPAQPTRLNSSYSIHSLLGGSNNSSCSKKVQDQPATIISNVPQKHSLYSSTYQRTILTSPKSPDTAGGKSPSHITCKKRSPPYAANSPMHDTHPRSPTVQDYGRRTPPEPYRLPLSHAHQLHQTFYPPYAMPPQYVGPAGVELSPNSTRNQIQPPVHIPHTSHTTRGLSSPRSMTASPRESATTPRTVPKKTASIRREFASPTASNSSTATSCPSPGDRITSPERKSTSQLSSTTLMQKGSPSTTSASSPLPYYMYPSHQSNGATSPHTFATSTAPAPPTNNSAAAMVAAAAAAAAYIPTVVSPSIYHPYITTLSALRHNSLWSLHHYQGNSNPLITSHPHVAAATPNIAASRFSPPFHPFAYNGVDVAAVAVAAAAAAFGQSPAHSPSTTSPSLSSLQGLPLQHHLNHHQQQHLGLFPTTESRNLTPKPTDHMNSSYAANNRYTSSPVAHSAASTLSSIRTYSPPVTSTSSGPVESSTLYHSLRDELSSDGPLNLSKH